MLRCSVYIASINEMLGAIKALVTVAMPCIAVTVKYRYNHFALLRYFFNISCYQLYICRLIDTIAAFD